MRIEMRKNVQGWLLAGACVMCTGKSINAAEPEQRAQPSAPKETVESRPPAKSETGKQAKTIVLVKNTNPKSKSVASTTTTKPQAPKEKRTVGRYWRQLMSSLREINHAHRAKK